MAMRYEIHYIENSQGTGKVRQYVQIMKTRGLTPRRLAEAIQNMSSATEGDVRAVLSALTYFARRELAQGGAFHLPGVGYLSLSVGFKEPPEKTDKKLTARRLCVRGINFRPEKRLLDGVRRDAAFEKSERTTLSAQYTADELWPLVDAYLTENRYLTRRQMMVHFGLSLYKTKQWLNRFVEQGKLVPQGSRVQTLYFKA